MSLVSSDIEDLYAKPDLYAKHAKTKKLVEDLVMSRYGEDFLSKSQRSFMRQLRKSHQSSGIYSISSVETRSEDDNVIHNTFTIPHEDLSVGTDNLSALISYRHVKNKSEYYCDYEEISDDEEVSVHYQNLNEKLQQILKACYLDDLTKKSNQSFSRARLEAEKLLLLTTLKRESLHDRFDYKDISYEEVDLNTGRINVRSIKLFPEKPDRRYREYFFCVLKFGFESFSSNVVEINSNGTVNFKGDFTFSNLPVDFQISVTIYSLKVKRTPNISCISVPIFGKHKNISTETPDIRYRPSLFNFWGQTFITAAHFIQPQEFAKPKARFYANQCRMSAEITGEVILDLNLSGFLDLCEDKDDGKCLFWEKMFVVLDGTKLKFSKYPSSEDLYKVLDLVNCVSVSVPDLYIRKRSLMLHFSDADGKSVKFYVAADSKDDFECWRRYLEAILTLIQSWNSVGYKF